MGSIIRKLQRLVNLHSGNFLIFHRILLGKGTNLPTAFITVSDTIAIWFLKKAQAMGYRIPADFSIVGFEDSPGSSLLDPPLTTFKQDYSLCGKTAFEALMSLTGDSTPPQSRTLITPEFIIRKSCAPPPST